MRRIDFNQEKYAKRVNVSGKKFSNIENNRSNSSVECRANFNLTDSIKKYSRG